MPIGAGLVGLLAEIFGLRTAFAVATALLSVPFIRVVTPAVLDDVMKRSGQPT